MKKKFTVGLSILSIFILLTYTDSLIAQDDVNVKTEIVIKGKYGSANGEFGLKEFEDQSFAEPSGLVIDSKKNIYIADPLNNRIQKFDKSGKFLFKTNLNIQKKMQRFTITIDDLAVDQSDNLYAVSRHEQKVFKYAPDGKHIQNINLKELEIAWDRRRGWRSGGYFQSERISVDLIDNIYLEGKQELIKFDNKGKLVKKWERKSISRAASYFLDTKGNLYYSKGINLWERYDQKGNFMGSVICEKEPFLAYIPSAGGSCQFPPKFIDKNGFRYYFELKPKTSELAAIVKLDKNGNIKRYKAPSIDIWQTPNMTKFDADGNLYGYGADDKKQEYWIVRISFN